MPVSMELRPHLSPRVVRPGNILPKSLRDWTSHILTQALSTQFYDLSSFFYSSLQISQVLPDTSTHGIYLKTKILVGFLAKAGSSRSGLYPYRSQHQRIAPSHWKHMARSQPLQSEPCCVVTTPFVDTPVAGKMDGLTNSLVGTFEIGPRCRTMHVMQASAW